MTMIRHGDILLRQIAAPPADVELGAPGERLVLATGEATGHAHVLTGLARTGLHQRRALLQLLEPGALTHEEHKTVPVPPGWYEVIRQRVYAPGGPLRVAD
jgi:hypothetical protein